MVLDWETDTRRQLEIPVLRRYHKWLIRRGVPGYSWQQLFSDYRLCVAMCVYVAVEYGRDSKHQRTVAALLKTNAAKSADRL